MTSSEILEKRDFNGIKMPQRMENPKPGPGLARNQDFAKGVRLEPKVQNFVFVILWKTSYFNVVIWITFRTFLEPFEMNEKF